MRKVAPSRPHLQKSETQMKPSEATEQSALVLAMGALSKRNYGAE
jgi:hypothetical protein